MDDDDRTAKTIDEIENSILGAHQHLGSLTGYKPLSNSF